MEKLFEHETLSQLETFDLNVSMVLGNCNSYD